MRLPIKLALALPLALLLVCIAGLRTGAAADCKHKADPVWDTQYLVFEGGGPDEGPSADIVANIASLKTTFGPVYPQDKRAYAYGVQEVRFLTRSTDFVRAEVAQECRIAERENVPLFFHLDPLYGWGADEEKSPADAPRIKYWNDPGMREWIEFPTAGVLPNRIPRTWFNWGPWCSPAPAFPAIGAPKFVDFARAQLRNAVAQPVGEWIARLHREGKDYLFAGIDVGWETCILSYRGIAPDKLPRAEWPVAARGITMQPWEAGAQLGYASLYAQGWNEEKLQHAAQKRGLARNAFFNELCYHSIHDYVQALARTCAESGIPTDRIYTHIVAMASVDLSRANSSVPPIWTAVNPYSIPGFTMDNRGAAVYNLAELKREITAADPQQTRFAVSESYLFHYADSYGMRENLSEAFDNGCTMKDVLGALPFVKAPGGHPEPAGAVGVIRDWLAAGTSAPQPAL